MAQTSCNQLDVVLPGGEKFELRTEPFRYSQVTDYELAPEPWRHGT